MRSLVILIIFVISSIFLYSQEAWTHFYDPFYPYASIYYVRDILVCSDGGYTVNGSCLEFEGQACRGFVMKTNSDGDLLWANIDVLNDQCANGSHAMVETLDGGILSASSYPPGGGIMILKRDVNGNCEWFNVLEEIQIYSMCNTSDSNIVLAGYHSENYQNVWPYLIKMDQQANILWSKVYSFEDYEWGLVNAVIKTSDGGYLLTGEVRDNEMGDAILAIKTDANGDSLWTRILDATPLDDEGQTIVETEDGQILVGGYLEESSGFIWKLDNDGNEIWFETPDEGQCSYINANDNTIISLSKLGHGYISKFDPDYNIDWMSNIPHFIGNGKALDITNDNHLVVALYDSGEVGISKIHPDGTDVYQELIISPEIITKIYPNPFNPSTTIEFSIQNDSNINLTIYNLKGQKVRTLKKNHLEKGTHSVKWDGKDDSGDSLSSGIYFYKLNVNGKTEAVIKCLILK